MVANATLPPASFYSCPTKSMMSQPEDSTTERCTADSSRFSVAGLDIVFPEMTRCASEAITACWRTTRSRSPRGNSWRWRTKLNACGPLSRLPAGRKVGAGKGFVHGVLQAHLDAAECIGDQREAEQADLGVVVDGDAGEVGDRLDQRLAAGLVPGRRRFGGRGAGSYEAGPLDLAGFGRRRR